MRGFTTLGQTPDSILEIWRNAELDGQVEVYTVGSEYRGRIGNAKLNAHGTLYVKGYLMGMPFIGRSTTWTRVKN